MKKNTRTTRDLDTCQSYLLNRTNATPPDDGVVHTFETNLTPEEVEILRRNSERLGEETGEEPSMFT